MCLRFSQYGTTRNHGCTKGNQCPYIHPPLCKDSELTRVCTNRDCKKTHLKYTRRFDEMPTARPSPKDTATENAPNSQKKGKKKTGGTKSTITKTADSSPPGLTDTRSMEDFLIVMMGSLRDDIFQKMNSLDMKVEQMKLKVDLSLDSIREEFRGYTPPRPANLTLMKPDVGTPVTFDVEGALKRFRNLSALTPGV